MTETQSICSTCYSIIPAIIEKSDVVKLHKSCSECGDISVIIERNLYFYDEVMHNEQHDWFKEHVSVTLLDVTDRCNIQCPHCYHMPGDQPDNSIDFIVEQALSCEKADRGYVLMGAEPTMRKDLPELVRTLKEKSGKTVSIYTNGIKLASKKLVQELEDAGLDAVLFSLHTTDYLRDNANSKKLYDAKLKGLVNVQNSKINLDNVSISLCSYEDIPETLATIKVIKEMLNDDVYFRLRSPSKIGICEDKTFYLSDFYMALAHSCKELGMEFYLAPNSDNGAYHVMVYIDDMLVRLIRWPSIEQVDLGELQCPPYALFVPEIGEVNFVHSALIQEAIKTKKLTPERLKEIAK